MNSKEVVVAAASNVDCIKTENKVSKSFLNGAAVYAGYASSVNNKTKIISCVGEEDGNDEMIEKAKKYRSEKTPEFNIIKIKGGKSFRQFFGEKDGSLEVVDKDYGNYNDWDPDVEEFETDVLLLGTGNPIFQKAVLDSCKHAEHILLDSKLIHFQKRADKVDELLKRVDTFFGTKEEVEQLLKNCKLPITMTSSLFDKYPNLEVIVEKNAGKGGRVFLSDGTFYTYQPEIPKKELCSDGAGDVFAGTYASLLAKGENIKEIIEKSAQSAALSVSLFGINKAKKGLEIDNSYRIIVKEGRWKNRDGRESKDTNRSN